MSTSGSSVSPIGTSVTVRTGAGGDLFLIGHDVGLYVGSGGSGVNCQLAWNTGASAPSAGNNLLLATPVTSTSSTNTVQGAYRLLNAGLSANTDYTFRLYVYRSGGSGASCNVPANSVSFTVLGQ